MDITHLVQCEHVEVTDVILLGVSDPSSALLFIYHLPHILIHKRPLREKTTRAQLMVQHTDVTDVQTDVTVQF